MATPRPKPAAPPAEGAILLAEYEYARGTLRAWRLPAAQGGGVALDRWWAEPGAGKGQVSMVEPGCELTVELESVPKGWTYVKLLCDGEPLATYEVDEDGDEVTSREVAEGVHSVVEVVYAAFRPAV